MKRANVADRCAKASLLLPSSGAELQTAVELADRAVQLGHTTDALRYYLFAQSLARYRSGNWAAAASCAEEVIALSTNKSPIAPALACTTLAMAKHQLGSAAEARAALKKAVALHNEKWPDLDRGYDGNSWADGLFAKVLIREATALIEGDLRSVD